MRRRCEAVGVSRKAAPPAGECSVCGHFDQLRDGLVKAHKQRRVGRNGPYTSGEICAGGGQPPESPIPSEREVAAQ